MYDITQVAKRYFDVRLTNRDENGNPHAVELKVEPPTLKQLGKLIAIQKANPADAIMELQDAIRSILSKNKTHYKVPEDYVSRMTLDQLVGLLTVYMNWLSETRKEKN